MAAPLHFIRCLCCTLLGASTIIRCLHSCTRLHPHYIAPSLLHHTPNYTPTAPLSPLRFTTPPLCPCSYASCASLRFLCLLAGLIQSLQRGSAGAHGTAAPGSVVCGHGHGHGWGMGMGHGEWGHAGHSHAVIQCKDILGCFLVCYPNPSLTPAFTTSAAPPVPDVPPLRPLQHPLCPLLKGPAFHPPRRPSFSCSLSVSSAPSPSDIAASSWSNDYNFLSLALTPSKARKVAEHAGLRNETETEDIPTGPHPLAPYGLHFIQALNVSGLFGLA